MAVTLEQLMVEVRADVRQALGELGKLETAQTSLATRTKGLARSMGLAFGGAAVVGGITKVLGMAMDFDKTIRTVGVQTGTTGKQLASLGDLAKQMGADTIFSAQDAGNAMLELAKGGMTAAQIKGGALQTTMTLAAAGSLELGDAATYVSQGMHTFHLAADQASRVTTALAGGANASAADVSDLGQALSQVGPGARNAGLSIEETVSALAAFSNAGINGSDAGTSLKTMLTRLVPTTKKAKMEMADLGLKFSDSKGNMDDLETVAQKLHDAFGPLSQAQRTQALNTIFGSDATRAASVLMDEGRKGIRKYETATKDQAKATDMANVAMGGASGAWENFKGTVETTAISVGQKALPALTDFLNWGTGLLNQAPQWGSTVKESFGWIVDAGGDVLTVTKALGGVVGPLAGWFAELPGPVKSTATEAAVLAFVMPRVASGITMAGTAATGAVTKVAAFGSSLTLANAKAGKFSSTLTTIAGVGGMIALQKGADSGSKSVSLLGGALSGAFIGGSLGSVIPGVGTAIGGVAGAAAGATIEGLKLHDATVKVDTSMSDARGTVANFAGTLDQVTGAYTRATKASILDAAQKAGVIPLTQKLGVATRDVIGASLGQEGALKRVNAAMVENGKALSGSEQSTVNTWLRNNTAAFANQANQIRNNTRDLKGWGQATKGLPKEVVTTLKQIGGPLSLSQLRSLKKQYDLNPKQVRTVIAAVGTEVALRKVHGVWQAVQDGEKVKANLNPWVATFSSGMDKAQKRAVAGTDLLTETLGKRTGKARANLAPFMASVTQGIEPAKSEASTGGTQVGTNLRTGVIAGFAGTQASLVAQAVAAVHAAVSAAKAAARSKSPSREMAEKVGQPLGEGMAVGLAERVPMLGKASSDAVKHTVKEAKAQAEKERQKMVDAGKSLMDSLMSSVRAGGNDWQKLFQRLGNWAEKALTGKAQDELVKQVRKANRELKGLYAERLTIETALANAQAELQRRQDERSSFVTDATAGMASQATVVGVGSNADTIKASLGRRLANVKEFAGLLQTLKTQGWSNDVIREIASAGVDQGLQAARALAAASVDDRAAIQGAYNEIGSIAKSTAASLGSQMYDAGVNSQQSLVDGLKAQDAAVNAAIAAIGQGLVKQLKHDLKQAGKHGAQGMADGLNEGAGSVWVAATNLAKMAKAAVEAELKIKSPSRVMRALGRFTGMGLAGGILDTQKDVAKASVALARAAVPGLDPGSIYTSTPSYGATQGSLPTAGPTFVFQTYNPVAEPQSRTTNKALNRAATVGLIR